MEPRPPRLSPRLRVRDRIRQGILLRRPLPSEVAVDEANLKATLRVEREDADIELEAKEAEALRDAVPVLHQLWNVADAHIPPKPGARGRAIVKAQEQARRALGPLFRQQTEYNASNARAISSLMNRSIRQEEIVESLAGEAFDAISVSLRRHTEALLELDRTLSRIERDLAKVLPVESDIDHLAFAERFRGSEDEAKERRRPYVDLLSRGDGKVVDLAAGRGELLELLRDAGVESRGFETAVALVDHCRAKGLPVERLGPLSALENEEAASLGGVAAIGLVSTLEPGALVRLVRLAAKSLQAGGVLLLDLAEPSGLAPAHSYDPEQVGWLLEQEGFGGVAMDSRAVSGQKA